MPTLPTTIHHPSTHRTDDPSRTPDKPPAKKSWHPPTLTTLITPRINKHPGVYEATIYGISYGPS